MAVFPNPTNNHKVSITCENAIETIQVITINGQVLQKIQYPVFENKTYTLENLPSGFYFLKLGSNQQSVTKKILVN